MYLSMKAVFITNCFTICRRFYCVPQIKNKYSALIIGGGHNGLVCASYLQRAGLDVCVLERRSVIGGAAVTEEIIPGFKFSRASYVLSLLQPEIVADLELKKYGLKVYKRDPSSYTPIRPSMWSKGGPRSLTLGSNKKFNAEQISSFSVEDVQAYEEYEILLDKIARTLDIFMKIPLSEIVEILETPSVLDKMRKLISKPQVRDAVFRLLKLGPDVLHLYEFFTSPCIHILRRWFCSEILIATLATDSVIGFMGTPDMPGTGYGLLHHIMGEWEGVRGAWGYPEGGMGAVTKALAASAEATGVHIFTNAKVQHIKVDSRGFACGIVLEDGTEVNSDIILSSATPKVTFLDLISSELLPEDFLHDVQHIDYSSPVTKINVALNQLPNFLSDPCSEPGLPLPIHQSTIHLNCEHSDFMFDAYQDAFQGKLCQRPLIEMVIPSSLDPTLAPTGCHVCLLFTQYTPYTLANEEEWNEEMKEKYANIVFDNIEEYAPGFKTSIIGKEVLSPPDLERIFGLTGGNIFHGAMTLHQLFLSRPTAARISSQKGVNFSKIRATMHRSPFTPVPRLLLCGSGAHPGGGVMGSPGLIAAKAALKLLNRN